MRTILGVDPGKTTGWVVVEAPDDGPAKVVESGECPGDVWGLSNLFTNFDVFWGGNRPELCTVVCEDWDSRTNEFKPDPRQACYPAGMTQMLACQLGIKCVMQMPVTRTKISDDKGVMEPLGYWLEGGGGHKRQALRHVLRFLIAEAHHLPTMEHLQPRT